jgi:DNA (cytosine-5)-methyltransferase 1
MDKECQAKEKRIERGILWRFYKQTKQTDMIKIGTDFSGIGSPEAALKRLNIPHHNVFACDIDKYARQSFLELNSPDLFYDDITTRDYKEVPQLDLYVAGFPCQSFSHAGKRGGFNDTRGTLFYNVAEFIKVNQPACFILENVKGLLSHDNGKTFQTITDVLTNGGGTLNGQIGMDTIEDGLGYHVYTKVLNTKDYEIPQNRERIFIVGFKYWRTFNFPVKIPLKLKLKDMLQDNPNSKYILSKKMVENIFEPSKGDWKSGNMTIDSNIAKCINARVFKMGRADTDNYITVKQLNPSKESGGQQPYQQNRVYDINGLAPALVSELGGEMSHNINTSKIRRLTPLECWRLQGFTDEEFYKAQKVNSDTQLYKQAGNSITVNVMTAILKKIYLS